MSNLSNIIVFFTSIYFTKERNNSLEFLNEFVNKNDYSSPKDIPAYDNFWNIEW